MYVNLFGNNGGIKDIYVYIFDSSVGAGAIVVDFELNQGTLYGVRELGTDRG